MHHHSLSFRLQMPSLKKKDAPHLHDVIKNTIYHQIKHHEQNNHYSPQKNLIQQTRRLLSRDPPPQQKNKTVAAQNIAINQQQKRRRMSNNLKNRHSTKTATFRQHPQIFNQLNTIDINKIKRYREQIEHQEAQIQLALMQQRLRRKWMIKTSRVRSRVNQEIARQTVQHEATLHRHSIQSEGDSMIQVTVRPHRHMLQKRKSKFQPWCTSDNNA